MVRGGSVERQGLVKAKEQLLLASELTFDDERADRLAALARRVDELADGDRPDADAVAAVDDRLRRLRADTHHDVRDAIVRAQELLASYRSGATASV